MSGREIGNEVGWDGAVDKFCYINTLIFSPSCGTHVEISLSKTT